MFMLAFMPTPDVLMGPCLCAVPILLCRLARCCPVPGRIPVPGLMPAPGGTPARLPGRGPPIPVPPRLLGRSDMAATADSGDGGSNSGRSVLLARIPGGYGGGMYVFMRAMGIWEITQPFSPGEGTSEAEIMNAFKNSRVLVKGPYVFTYEYWLLVIGGR
eukprot:scaffold1877_cov140-Isochrysis_galbana.AAC.7